MSREERSRRMALIRSKWTKPEKFLHNYLRGHKVKHKMHPKIKGSPDIIIPEKKLAIFIDGCFWHGCKKCYSRPVNNADFWKNKLISNKKRDRLNARSLKASGWSVIRLWEHAICKKHSFLRINNALVKTKHRKVLKDAQQ